jgi:hypothetical protein
VSPALLADLLLYLHLGYATFVVVGLLAIWLGVLLGWDWVRRPLFRAPHLVCTLIVSVEAVIGMICPLTAWEHELRLRAGQYAEDIPFMARLARELLVLDVPQWVLTLCHVVFGLVVLATFFLVPIRRSAASGARGATAP